MDINELNQGLRGIGMLSETITPDLTPKKDNTTAVTKVKKPVQDVVEQQVTTKKKGKYRKPAGGGFLPSKKAVFRRLEMQETRPFTTLESGERILMVGKKGRRTLEEYHADNMADLENSYSDEGEYIDNEYLKVVGYDNDSDMELALKLSMLSYTLEKDSRIKEELIEDASDDKLDNDLQQALIASRYEYACNQTEELDVDPYCDDNATDSSSDEEHNSAGYEDEEDYFMERFTNNTDSQAELREEQNNSLQETQCPVCSALIPTDAADMRIHYSTSADAQHTVSSLRVKRYRGVFYYL